MLLDFSLHLKMKYKDMKNSIHIYSNVHRYESVY